MSEILRQACFVTDVDRTLYRTGVAALKLLMAAETIVGVATSDIASEIDDRRARGQTTQIMDWLYDIGASGHANDIFQLFVDSTKPEEVTYGDVRDYVDAIEESEFITAVLLTMGPGLHQEAKICTMGLQGRLPYVIVDPATTGNAEVKDWQVRSWIDPATGLIVPPLSQPVSPRGLRGGTTPARNAIMIEDKYGAFGTGVNRPKPGQGDPGIGGFWVDRPEERSRILSYEERELIPPSIEYVEGLTAITTHIRGYEANTNHPMYQRLHAA